jgi:hypothetical protein
MICRAVILSVVIHQCDMWSLAAGKNINCTCLKPEWSGNVWTEVGWSMWEIWSINYIRRHTVTRTGLVMCGPAVNQLVREPELVSRWSGGLDQWYSTWGTHTPGCKRRHLRGYVKLKIYIYILFYDKHWIIRATFRVGHKRPRRKDMRFGSAISLSLISLLYAILIWAASFILFHTVQDATHT